MTYSDRLARGFDMLADDPVEHPRGCDFQEIDRMPWICDRLYSLGDLVRMAAVKRKLDRAIDTGR